ncbi:MAG: peptidase [Acidobacteria bacterium]|nr:peptidase [Acidobacteriota bacterium]MCA1610091.1 peptidase [Acidobacteriota bacterium]
MRRTYGLAVLCLAGALSGCAAAVSRPDGSASVPSGSTAAPSSAPVAGRSGADAMAIAPDVPARVRQFPPTRIDYDRTLLDERETRTLQLLIEASRELDAIFARQVSEEVPSTRQALERVGGDQRPLAVAAIEYFDINAGPWDRLKGDEPFVGRRPKPKGAGFYPLDMSRDELEKWIATHPQDREGFQSLFTVIRRDGDRLVAIPYAKFYQPALTRAAEKLRAAAASTGNASLKKFLTLRADAFLSDDYFASDVAWMDLDSDIEIAIGPYEVYEDALFNFKAAYESFVTVRDKAESAHLAVYARHLPDMERNLPIPEAHKNFTRKFESPIRVVQEAFTSGDARRGVQTAAFNLPNDEKVREAKGSKKVLLKNVMEAKFQQSGRPVAERVMDPSQASRLSFDPYFNHTLFHELSHGLGPGVITGPDGKRVEARLLLKNIYSTIEECKADAVGLWNLLYALDQKWLTSFDEESLAVTYVGLMFRSMRFGLEEAHGGGTAVQWNWFREKGAIVPSAGGRFLAKRDRFREAVKSLANELLMIEATGDFERGRRLLERYGKSTPEIAAVTGRLSEIPVDIKPVFTAAGE